MNEKKLGWIEKGSLGFEDWAASPSFLLNISESAPWVGAGGGNARVALQSPHPLYCSLLPPTFANWLRNLMSFMPWRSHTRTPNSQFQRLINKRQWCFFYLITATYVKHEWGLILGGQFRLKVGADEPDAVERALDLGCYDLSSRCSSSATY